MNQELESVVERYSAPLYRLAFSYCANRPDAEDVVQETFYEYLRRKPSFSAEAQRRSWLMTVAANRCRDLFRSAWRRRVVPLEAAANVAAAEPEAYPEVAEALARLAPGDRAAVYLFYYEQLPTKEIASILRMTDSAVRKRLSRARRELQTLLGGEADGR